MYQCEAIYMYYSLFINVQMGFNFLGFLGVSSACGNDFCKQDSGPYLSGNLKDMMVVYMLHSALSLFCSPTVRPQKRRGP